MPKPKSKGSVLRLHQHVACRSSRHADLPSFAAGGRILADAPRIIAYVQLPTKRFAIHVLLVFAPCAASKINDHLIRKISLPPWVSNAGRKPVRHKEEAIHLEGLRLHKTRGGIIPFSCRPPHPAAAPLAADKNNPCNSGSPGLNNPGHAAPCDRYSHHHEPGAGPREQHARPTRPLESIRSISAGCGLLLRARESVTRRRSVYCAYQKGRNEPQAAAAASQPAMMGCGWAGRGGAGGTAGSSRVCPHAHADAMIRGHCAA